MSGSENNLQLHLPSVELGDAGEYICRVTLGDGTVVGPSSAGTLTVLELSAIDAPSDQFVLLNSTATLNCSFPGALTTWFRNGMVVPEGVVRSANLSNEGQYMCNLYSPAHSARIEMTVMLHVICESLHVLFPDQHTPRIN